MGINDNNCKHPDLSEEEMEMLRSENAMLKAKVNELQGKLKGNVLRTKNLRRGKECPS